MEDNTGIIQVGVVVNNLNASLDFYTNVIGMKEVRAFSISEAFGKMSGLSGGVPFSVKVLQLKEGDCATNFKIMEFEKKPAQETKQNIQDAIGIQYITINVESLKPFISRLKEHGIPLLGETPVQLDEDRYFVLVKDPNDIFIELIGPKE